MPPFSKIIYEVPRVENTIPVALYQISSPERFSLEDDKFVIYAGGHGFNIQLSPNDPQHELKLASSLSTVDWSNSTLLVMNTSLIIWFPAAKLGLEIPYQAIMLHALKDSGATVLYLQVFSSPAVAAIPNHDSEFVPTVAFEISGGSESSSDGLLAQVDSSIGSIYEGLSQCSALHLDSDDSDNEGDGDNSGFYSKSHPIEPNFDAHSDVEIPEAWAPETLLNTTGDADDLGELPDENPDHEAAMPVDVGYASIAGIVRKRDNDASNSPKNRRLH